MVRNWEGSKYRLHYSMERYWEGIKVQVLLHMYAKEVGGKFSTGFITIWQGTVRVVKYRFHYRNREGSKVQFSLTYGKELGGKKSTGFITVW